LFIIWEAPLRPVLRYPGIDDNHDSIMQTYMSYRYAGNILHCLRGEPGSLFASNAFYPYPEGSLLNSDNRLVPSLVFFPFWLWFRENPNTCVAVTQLMLELLTISCAYFAARCLLAWSLRPSAIFAFLTTAIPFRFIEFSRLQGYCYFVTIVILATLFALLRHWSLTRLAVLTLMIIINAYTSLYYSAMLVPAYCIAIIVTLPAARKLPRRELCRRAGWIIVALLCAILGGIPLANYYLGQFASLETKHLIFGAHGREQLQSAPATDMWQTFTEVELPRQNFHRTISYLFTGEGYNQGFSRSYFTYGVGICLLALAYALRGTRDRQYWFIVLTLAFYLLTNHETIFTNWVISNPLFSYLRLYYRSIFIICILGSLAAARSLPLIARRQSVITSLILLIAIAYYFTSANVIFTTAEAYPLPTRQQVTGVMNTLADAPGQTVLFLPMGHFFDVFYLKQFIFLPNWQTPNAFSQHYSYRYWRRVQLLNQFPDANSIEAIFLRKHSRTALCWASEN